jgi:hypothetical protein
MFDIEFGGVLKINVLCLKAVSRKSAMLGVSHPPRPLPSTINDRPFPFGFTKQLFVG